MFPLEKDMEIKVTDIDPSGRVYQASRKKFADKRRNSHPYTSLSVREIPIK